MLGTNKLQASRANKPVRLAYLVSHPIQYQAPLLRRIAQEPDIDLTVFFGSDFSLKEYKDEGFGGIGVKWDIPLLDGYQYEFLPAMLHRGVDSSLPTATSPLSRGIFERLRGSGSTPGFDVLWSHGYATVNAMHAMLAARSLGIPVLMRTDSSLRDRARSGATLAAKRLFFSMLSQLVSGVLPVGKLNSEYWTYYFGDRIPQFMMPYAVDNDFFAQRSQQASAGRAGLQAELNLDPSRQVILFASKLQERKLCRQLIEAYARLAPAPGVEPLPYLLIVGDGEERSALESQAKATGFDGIRFCGFRNQSELPRFFDLATVFVLPARHEPWGLIINEVMNAGRAVIVTDDVGCQPDLVTDGVEGCVYPVGDVDALTHCLRRVLEVPGAAEAMGQRAFERIQTFSFEEDIHALRLALAHLTRKFIA